MSAPLRRLVASFLMLLIIAAWIILAMLLGSYLAAIPKWVAPLFYIIAGIGWIFPLRPIFKWMNKPLEDAEREQGY